jgi:hypothetical protein
MKNFKFLLRLNIGSFHPQLSPYFDFYGQWTTRKSRLTNGQLDFPSIPQTVSHILIKSDTGDFQEQMSVNLNYQSHGFIENSSLPVNNNSYTILQTLDCYSHGVLKQVYASPSRLLMLTCTRPCTKLTGVLVNWQQNL